MSAEFGARQVENPQFSQTEQKPRFTREQMVTPIGGFTEFGSNAFKFIGLVIPQLFDPDVSEARKREVYDEFLQLSENLGLRNDGQLDHQALRDLAKIIYEVIPKLPSSKALITQSKSI